MTSRSRSETASTTLDDQRSNPATARSAGRDQRRGTLVFVVKLTVTLALLAGLLAFSDIGALPSILSDVEPLMFTLGFVIQNFGSVVVPAFVSHRTLRSGRLELTLADLIRANFVVRFYNVLLPRSTATAVRWMKYRKGGGGSRSAALVVLELLVHGLAAAAIALIVLGWEANNLRSGGLALIVVSAATLLGLFLFFLPYVWPRASSLLRAVMRPVVKVSPSIIRDKLQSTVEAITRYHTLPAGELVWMFTLALASALLAVLGQYLFAVMLDVPATFLALLWIRSVVYFLNYIPFTIGGAGIREVGYVAFLSLYGIPSGEALALSLVVLGSHLLAALGGAGVELWEHFIRSGSDSSAATDGDGRSDPLNHSSEAH